MELFGRVVLMLIVSIIGFLPIYAEREFQKERLEAELMLELLLWEQKIQRDGIIEKNKFEYFYDRMQGLGFIVDLNLETAAYREWIGEEDFFINQMAVSQLELTTSSEIEEILYANNQYQIDKRDYITIKAAGHTIGGEVQISE